MNGHRAVVLVPFGLFGRMSEKQKPRAGGHRPLAKAMPRARFYLVRVEGERIGALYAHPSLPEQRFALGPYGGAARFASIIEAQKELAEVLEYLRTFPDLYAGAVAGIEMHEVVSMGFEPV